MTAVSRFSAVKLAARSTELIGPNAVAGSCSSRAVRPVKCTSPAKASVTGPGRDGAPDVPGVPGAPGRPGEPEWRGVAPGWAAVRAAAGAASGARTPEQPAASSARRLVVTASDRQVTTGTA